VQAALGAARSEPQANGVTRVAIDTSRFKNGLKVEIDGEPFNMIFFQHVKPGKGGAFVRTKLRNLRNGKVIERTFRSGERLEEADVQDRRMSYLYQDGDGLVFMDSESFDQMSIPLERVGAAKDYLKENLEVDVLLYKGNAINIELPAFIEAVITKTEPGIKGDTASGSTKPATIETGAVVQVPLFVKEGEKIRVDTRTGEYVERVSK
jgi:elongation factor P